MNWAAAKGGKEASTNSADIFKLWKAACYWHHQWPLKTQGRKQKSCHASSLGILIHTWCWGQPSWQWQLPRWQRGAAVFRASAPRGWQKELCKGDCMTLGALDWGTSLSLSAKLLSPKFHQAHEGGFWFFWGVFLKLRVKIGHCRKQLLSQLLRHYFWIPKLSVFKKQLREKLVLQYVINFVIVKAFFLSTSLITLFTK